MEEGTDDGDDGVAIRIGDDDSANERLRKLLLPAVREPDCRNTIPHTNGADLILPVPVAEREVPIVRLIVNHICHIAPYTKMAKTEGYLMLFVSPSREIPVDVCLESCCCLEDRTETYESTTMVVLLMFFVWIIRYSGTYYLS